MLVRCVYASRSYVYVFVSVCVSACTVLLMTHIDLSSMFEARQCTSQCSADVTTGLRYSAKLGCTLNNSVKVTVRNRMKNWETGTLSSLVT